VTVSRSGPRTGGQKRRNPVLSSFVVPYALINYPRGDPIKLGGTAGFRAVDKSRVRLAARVLAPQCDRGEDACGRLRAVRPMRASLVPRRELLRGLGS
jgi:hypothetical protein